MKTNDPMDSTITPDGTVNKSMIPYHVALKHVCVPLGVKGETLTLAATGSISKETVSDIEMITGLGVAVVRADAESIMRAIKTLYSCPEPGCGETEETYELCGGQPEAYGLPHDYPETVERICDRMLQNAVKAGTDELLIRCSEKRVEITSRKNGHWTTENSPEPESSGWIVASFVRRAAHSRVKSALDAGAMIEEAVKFDRCPRGEYLDVKLEIGSEVLGVKLKLTDIPSKEGGGDLISIIFPDGADHE